VASSSTAEEFIPDVEEVEDAFDGTADELERDGASNSLISYKKLPTDKFTSEQFFHVRDEIVHSDFQEMLSDRQTFLADEVGRL
jgi:hypothetical protein